MKKYFAPGCALRIYKPHLAEKLLQYLNAEAGGVSETLTCCRNHPEFQDNSTVINTCPGCDRRYRENYTNILTVSLWEVLADSNFPFPDYAGKQMTITDACPTRNQARVHKAVRALLHKMNIQLVEPERTATNSVCCGDSFVSTLPVDQVKEQMKKRADQMPLEDVVVYCVSCSKSMFIGGKKPHYIVDLLFREETDPQTLEPEDWHKEIDDFVAAH